MADEKSALPVWQADCTHKTWQFFTQTLRGVVWRMRKSLWVILTVLLVIIGAPNAHADSYSATFTCSGICTSTPSSTTATFTLSGSNSIGVFTWDTVSYSFGLPINWLPTDSYTWAGFSDTTATSGTTFLTFRIYDLTISNIFGVQTDSLCPSQQACLIGFDSGVLSFAPVVTPEPSSIALLLAGIGFLMVMRRR
jgi:hypothetical protein